MNKTTYTALTALDHNRVHTAAGETIELTAGEAKHLLASGAIKPGEPEAGGGSDQVNDQGGDTASELLGAVALAEDLQGRLDDANARLAAATDALQDSQQTIERLLTEASTQATALTASAARVTELEAQLAAMPAAKHGKTAKS